MWMRSAPAVRFNYLWTTFRKRPYTEEYLDIPHPVADGLRVPPPPSTKCVKVFATLGIGSDFVV